MEVVVQKATFQKYPAYKDSGSDWSGKIPTEWHALPIRAIFEERNEKNDGPKTDFILSVTKDRGVIPYDEKGQIGNNKSEDIERYKAVYPNDFVINKMNVIIGSLGMSKYHGAFSQVYLVYKPKSSEINIEYYSYIFSNPSFFKSLIRFCTGIMELRESLNKNDFKKIVLPFPDFKTQSKIVSFLDEKTDKIDRAIAQKERMIELLKERKQIIIQNAVTKGLDLSVKMKDSGVDWIGEIPEHWEVKRLRNIFRFSKGLTITKENLQDEGVLCINYGEIHSKYGFEVNPDIHPLKCVSEEYLNDNLNSLIKKGDFIFADTSEDLEGSGNFTYLNYDQPIFAGYHTIIAKPIIDAIPRFLAYVLDSASFRNQVRTRMKGVKVYSITQSTLKDLTCWFPATNEQEAIVKNLDKSCSRLEEVIKMEQSQIVKLKEYKASLIDSAVTGKIRVC